MSQLEKIATQARLMNICVFDIDEQITSTTRDLDEFVGICKRNGISDPKGWKELERIRNELKMLKEHWAKEGGISPAALTRTIVLTEQL